MAQNPLQANRMDHICQTCGDKGFIDLQLYCSKCQISMEHRYCLTEIPDVNDEEFNYICEKCEGLNHLVKRRPLRRIVVSDTLVQDLRKNLASSILVNKAEENLQKAESEVEIWEVPSALGTPVPEPFIEDEMPQVDENKTGKVPVAVQDSLKRTSSFSSSITMVKAEERIRDARPSPQTLEADVIVKDLPLLKRKRRLILNDSDESDEEITCVSYQEPQTPPKRKRRPILNGSDESDEEITLAGWQQPQAAAIRKRRLILDHSDESDEEISLAGCQEPQAAAAAPAPKIPSPPHSQRAQPIVDPIWRGCFEICSEKYYGVVAHLSSNVGLKVAEVSKLMPTVLSVEMLSRLDAWPKSFNVSAPSDDNIALYFFPENDDAIKAVLFHELVTSIMDLDLALRVLFDDAELSIFPSNQLPQDLWRFRGKFYLWGVFRGRKAAPTPESSGGHSIEKVSTVCKVTVSAIGTNKDSKSLRISPTLPSSKNSSYSPWTAKRQEANAGTDCCTLPSSSNLTRTSPLNTATHTVRNEMFGKQNCGEGEISVKNVTIPNNSIPPCPYKGAEMLGKNELPTRNGTNSGDAGLGSQSSSSYPSNPPRTGKFLMKNITSTREAAAGRNIMSESSSYPFKSPRTGELPIKSNPNEKTNPKPSCPTSNIGYCSDSPRTGEYTAKVEETSCYALPLQSNVLQRRPHIPLPQEKNKNQGGGDQERQKFNSRPRSVRSFDLDVCFNRGEKGHLKRDCPRGQQGVGDACFNCGEKGHMKKDCPKTQQGVGADDKGAEMSRKGELQTRNLTNTGNASIGTIKKSEASSPCPANSSYPTKSGNASPGTIKKSEPSSPRITNSSKGQGYTLPSPSNTNQVVRPCPPSQSTCDSLRIVEDYGERQKANAEAARNTLPSEPVSLQQQPQIHSYTATEDKQTSMFDKMHWETLFRAQPKAVAEARRSMFPSEPVSLYHHPQIHATSTATVDKQTSMFDKMHWETLFREHFPTKNVQENQVSAKQLQTLNEPVNQVKLNSTAEDMNLPLVPSKVVNQVPNFINSDSRVTAIVQLKQKRGDRGRRKQNQANTGKKCNQPSVGKKPNQEKLGKKSKQGLICFFCQQPGHKRSDCRHLLALLEEQKKYLQSLVPEIRIIVQQPNRLCTNRADDDHLGAHSLNGALVRKQPTLPLYIEAPFNVRPS